jgi:hypothetical protein
MGTMGKYCKAYYSKSFQAFPSWAANLANLRKNTTVDDSGNTPTTLLSLNDDDVLYLQENYAVTDGIFLDEHVVFASASDEWRRFCTDTLQFRVPEDVALAHASDSEAAEVTPGEAQT